MNTTTAVSLKRWTNWSYLIRGAEYLGDSKATTVAKMVQAGRASGPIVREFHRIQKDEGDEAAL
jgi:hypothetical protein